MTILKNTFSYFSDSWNRMGWLYAAASFAFIPFMRGNFWLDLVSNILIGAAVFCWGAHFQERKTCTRPVESEAK